MDNVPSDVYDSIDGWKGFTDGALGRELIREKINVLQGTVEEAGSNCVRVFRKEEGFNTTPDDSTGGTEEDYKEFLSSSSLYPLSTLLLKENTTKYST